MLRYKVNKRPCYKPPYRYAGDDKRREGVGFVVLRDALFNLFKDGVVARQLVGCIAVELRNLANSRIKLRVFGWHALQKAAPNTSKFFLLGGVCLIPVLEAFTMSYDC